MNKIKAKEKEVDLKVEQTKEKLIKMVIVNRYAIIKFHKGWICKRWKNINAALNALKDKTKSFIWKES